MNKLYKCALGLLTAFTLSFACFSSADTIDVVSSTDLYFRHEYASSTVNYTNTEGVFCLVVDSNCTQNCGTMTVDNVTINLKGSWDSDIYCTKGTNISINGLNNYYYFYMITQDFLDLYAPQYTSLQCQTEYNLIPISEVTANYCALNFGMIDPQECPINEGTGAIVRSNLMINDVPYAQNQNINVFIPDFLSWNIGFNDLYTVIEVEGYNADEEYIENVINQEKLTPTNKDIEEMLTGFMTNYFPYLALAIVFLYLARKIFKLFK